MYNLDICTQISGTNGMLDEAVSCERGMLPMDVNGTGCCLPSWGCCPSSLSVPNPLGAKPHFLGKFHHDLNQRPHHRWYPSIRGIIPFYGLISVNYHILPRHVPCLQHFSERRYGENFMIANMSCNTLLLLDAGGCPPHPNPSKIRGIFWGLKWPITISRLGKWW